MQKASSHRLHSKATMNPIPGDRFHLLYYGAPEWSRLLHIVGIWFQVLFHSANSGSFHLSLAVLVHYRLPRSI